MTKYSRWIALSVLMIAISGCMGLKPKLAETEWDCTEVSETGDWDCTEVDPNVALPEVAATSPPIHTSQSLQVFKYDPSELALSQPEPKPQPIEVVVPPPPMPVVESQSLVPTIEVTDQPQQVEVVQPDLNEPLYLQLAYRPETPQRIEDLPSSYFAVQLAAFTKKNGTTIYLENEEWIQESQVVRVLANDQVHYAILLGVYEDRDSAEQAVNSVSTYLNGSEPWIRSLSSLQTAIKAADDQYGVEF